MRAETQPSEQGPRTVSKPCICERSAPVTVIGSYIVRRDPNCPSHGQRSSQACDFERNGYRYCERPAQPVELNDGRTIHICDYHRLLIANMIRTEP